MEWVSELRDTLAVIHQAAHDNEQAFKEKSKAAYVVLEKLSEFNYRIGALENNSKNQVVHINRLKPWETPESNLFRVVVADETADMSEPVGKVKMGSPNLTHKQ